MNSSRAVELTRRLVQLDTTPTGQLTAAVALLSERLEDGGFEVEEQVYDDGQLNIVAHHGPADAPGPCLTGHVDTVPVNEQDWSQDPWGAEVVDGLMYGRGVADMKSGVAAAVEAAVSFAGMNADAPISVILTAQEELGSLGAARLAADRELPLASYLVVAEPTDLRPRIGHRGAFWVDLRARGRSCHASTPHLGANAISMLVEDLTWLTAFVDEELEAHPRLGPATSNIGTIRGGLQRNIVPDEAVAEVDIRLAGRSALSRLEQVVGHGLPRGSEATVRVNLPGVATEPTSPLMVRAAAIAGDDGTGAARFFTDASILTPALGDIPTVIWGPGSPDQAHVVDEHCAVAQIDLAVQQYMQLLCGDRATD